MCRVVGTARREDGGEKTLISTEQQIPRRSVDQLAELYIVHGEPKRVAVQCFRSKVLEQRIAKVR